MNIPNVFKETMKKVFYDKNIEIWSSAELTDSVGCVIGNGKGEKIEAIKGNFQFTTQEYIQKEYGRDIEANAIVTCEKTQAQMGNIIPYDGIDYYVRGIIPSDSHVTLLLYGDDENA